MTYAFDFLEVEMRPGKPRQTGLTIVRDRMRGLGEQREFLQTYGAFVDYVKISNMAPRLYPESFLLDKIRLYQSFDVVPFFGGILFENALAQGKADELASYLSAINAPAIEISNNILDLSADALADHIRAYTARGLQVFAEWGEKYPEKLLDPRKAEREIRVWHEAGASHVILERSEIDLLLAASSGEGGVGVLDDLQRSVGAGVLIFEVETQAQMVALLQGLGRDVNLGPNIDFELIRWLEPSRLGISREMGHRTIETYGGAAQVRSRLPDSSET